MLLTVDGHEQQLPRLDDLNQLVDVMKDLDHHIVLGQLDLALVRMGAIVDDAVHVQI